MLHRKWFLKYEKKALRTTGYTTAFIKNFYHEEKFEKEMLWELPCGA